MFKVGDKLVCINNNDLRSNYKDEKLFLTIGKVYDIIDVYENCILIDNDRIGIYRISSDR